MRVATYNVHGFVGTDGVRSVARVGDVLADLDADVIALQEVDAPGRAEEDGPLFELATRLGMTPLAGPTIAGPSRMYGNALLTRWPIARVQRHDISVSGREPRGMLEAWLRPPGGGASLRTLVTHLGLGLRERRRQIEALSDALATFTDVPTVVMGDFNEWRPRGLTLLRMNDAMGRAPKARSWPSRFPLFALDRIWVRPRRAIRGIWAVRTPLSRSASDHLPLCLGLDRERLRPPW